MELLNSYLNKTVVVFTRNFPSYTIRGVLSKINKDGEFYYVENNGCYIYFRFKHIVILNVNKDVLEIDCTK